jgi:hypothetical protein
VAVTNDCATSHLVFDSMILCVRVLDDPSRAVLDLMGRFID